VEIPLRCDVEFFGLLQEEVITLDALQAREQKAMTQKITELSKDMAQLTAPSKFSKTDMYRWRELLDIYLQAQVFFSTREQVSHAHKDSERLSFEFSEHLFHSFKDSRSLGSAADSSLPELFKKSE
jgi:E3 ubiquitin-protein ligase BAH